MARDAYEFMFGLGILKQRRPTAAERAARLRSDEERAKTAVPWSPDMKWEFKLTLKASTWTFRDLFPGAKPDEPVRSPSGRWIYKKRTLKKYSTMWTVADASAREKGDVMFDDVVLIPTLFEKNDQREPWMSITPMEVFTLRRGTQRAKGHTVIAGLGLGHQLIDVTHRKGVERVTLVERDEELVKWLLPRVKKLANKAVPIEVVVGNAFEELPKLKADIALVDIFPSYGHVGYEMSKLKRTSPGIEAWWGWGIGGYRVE